MGPGVNSRVVIIRNPYTFPRAKDPKNEILQLSETNKLVILLQSGISSYPFDEDELPDNVHLIKFSYYEGGEELLEEAKARIAALLQALGAEVQYDVMPILFNGAYVRLPEDLQVHVVQSAEDYQSSSHLSKVQISEAEIEAAEWTL